MGRLQSFAISKSVIKIFMLSFFQIIGLHFFSKKLLLKKLKILLNTEGYTFTPQFSGRVALQNLIQYFSSEMESSRCLYLPDYICNVVFKASEIVDANRIIYPTDVRCEPVLSFLKRAIRKKKVGIIVLASIFGSSALLKLLNREKVRKFIEKENIKIILDLCQDISLLKHVPISKNIGVIISFNNKSFPGLMGGGILYHDKLKFHEKSLPVGKKLKLYYILLRDIKLKYFLRRPAFVGKSYDYSRCVHFPYTFDNYKLSKIQFILAICGIKKINIYLRNKIDTINLYKKEIIKTFFYETSPYLILANPRFRKELNRKYKLSYAKHNDPKNTYKDITIIHNKGFDDFYSKNFSEPSPENSYSQITSTLKS
ncbi:MAG: hypothetical protein K2Y08_01525 [Alphaproteobacteria bacterium]|nr:hypothetical protein [Alphaproteobacteria bacterium]